MFPLTGCFNRIAADTAGQRPSVGKRVRIDRGRRKHVEGTVLRHLRNPFERQYGSDAQQMLREVIGRYGYRVQIESPSHGTFWVDADNVTVL